MAKLAAKYVVGIDPGGAHTGIVARQGRDLLNHALVNRGSSKQGKQPVEQYAQAAADVALSFGQWDAPGRVEFKIERVIPPRWYTKGKESPIHPANLVDVAIVAGVIAGRIAAVHGQEAVLWVRPSGHGKTPEMAPGARLDRIMHAKYPVQLLPAKNGGKYKDQMRHCRSAWDVSTCRADYDGAAK